MGCDIHLHIEIKAGGVWHHYSAPSIKRNYSLFEKMAGVRGDMENAITPPRGLPEDITEVTRMEVTYFGNYEKWGHSHSWFGLPEICKLEDWLKEQGGFDASMDLEHHILHCYLFRNSFGGVLRYPSDCGKQIEDVRFVFFFDN